MTIDGSAKLALNIAIKFDEYYFIEKDKQNYQKLLTLKEEYPNLNIKIFNADCNEVLPKIIASINWKYTRGILFIDPFATQLNFDILKDISLTKGLDVWYLFPFSAINRILTKDKNIDDKWEIVLNRCLGDPSWKNDLYRKNNQLNLFDDCEYEKVSALDVQNYIYRRMQTIFPYVSDKYLVLKNSKNSTMFMLFLLISNNSTKAINLVKKVEKDILKE